MKEWGPKTWAVASLLLASGGGYWRDEGGWYLVGAAFCAWLMSAITALERRRWP